MASSNPSNCCSVVRLTKLRHKSAEELISFFTVVGLTLTAYVYGMAHVTRVFVTDSDYPVLIKILLIITPTWIVWIGIFGSLYSIWKRDSFAVKLLPVPFQASLEETKTSVIQNGIQIQDPTITGIDSKKLETPVKLNTTTTVEMTATPPTPTVFVHWHACDKCKIRVPPRTWHCNHCNGCILRREHHCKYAMACIGEENQANFVGFLLYASLGAFYGFFIGALYRRDFVDGAPIWLTTVKSLSIIYPVIFEFGFHNIIAVFLLIYALFALKHCSNAIYLPATGQTAYEVKKNISRSQRAPGQPVLGWYAQLEDSLGTYPFLRIIIPFFPRRKITYEYNPDCELDMKPNSNYMNIFLESASSPNYTLGFGNGN